MISFQRKDSAEYWHREILSQQGFLHKRGDQYLPIRKLGEGSFGHVVLSKHRLSKFNVAVKLIEKPKVRKLFLQNNEAFEELSIFEELNSFCSPHILELVETFED